jgi:class III poly(R)-hydroxyalkanoic acid synthase PhaE subunit
MLNVAQGFQSLLQSCMAQATQQTGAAAQQDNPFLNMVQTLPLGYAREQQLAWQAYLKAQAEYQHCATHLMQQFATVFTRSLEQVPHVVEQRSRADKPVQSMRELYDVWIECGEQCFASIAMGEQFLAVQANHSNALSRLRIAEHALLEDWLKQRDLPTRSELNSVHQKLRSMSARIVELEQQLGSSDKSAKSARSKKKL